MMTSLHEQTQHTFLLIKVKSIWYKGLAKGTTFVLKL